ncbi:MAG: LacI family DNA-binding transcriptional regulator [Anaerolineales bacterium]|nr:LacI family DNA-binding transcriptional regulator [Anaerolineales bacterium]
MNFKSSRTTIKEVAAAAGVSTMTVSRVLNDRPDVSVETRRRVKKIIDEMEYQPSALARSLIQQRSYTLGVVTAGLKHIGPSFTLNGITSSAEKAGYALLLKELPHYHTSNVAPIFHDLISRHVDGIIWAVPEIGDNHAWLSDFSQTLDIPVIFLTMENRADVPIVSVDNYEGGRLVMLHLVEQGYRRIGHVAGPLDWWEARQRMAAWKDVLVEYGIAVQNTHWTEGNWSSASGVDAAEKLLAQYSDLDAIFVANDQMALGVMQVIHRRGLRIPEDIGVAGFDNIPESAFFYPALTTVQQDQFEVAKIALQEIVQYIEQSWLGEEPKEPHSILLSPALVVRDSSIRNDA